MDTAKKLNTPVFTANISGTRCVFIADRELVFTVFKDSIQEIDSLSLQKKDDHGLGENAWYRGAAGMMELERGRSDGRDPARLLGISPGPAGIMGNDADHAGA